VERRPVVLRELGLERLEQAKLLAQQVLQGLVKLLAGPFWAVRAEQQEVWQLEPERVRWQEQALSLGMRLCNGVWGGARMIKRPEERLQHQTQVEMRQATVASMGRVASRRARVRSSLAMKAKVRISGEAETMTLGVGAEMVG
jgi:hypothetical protein